MTALTADLNYLSKGGGDLKEYPVADNVKILKGSLVALDTAGFARPARATAGETIIGIADVQCDNTYVGHAAGARSPTTGYKGVSVMSGRHYLMTGTGFAQTSVGRTVW